MLEKALKKALSDHDTKVRNKALEEAAQVASKCGCTAFVVASIRELKEVSDG